MDIIDDEGRLFGLVNIVDVLVVLLVLSVVIAGAALIFSDEEPDGPNIQTTYATLDLGTHPTNIAAAINEGDTYSPSKHSKLTITDVSVTPEGDQHRVISRVKLRGPANQDLIDYDNAPPRLGRQLTIATNLYKLDGRIRSVGPADTLATDNSTVIVTDVLPSDQVEQIGSGDRIRSAGRTVATIEDVLVYPQDERLQQVYLTVDINTLNQQGNPYFGQTPLQTGQTISLPGDGYDIAGEIQQVGTGIERETTDVVLTQTLDVQTVEKITPGDVVQAGDDEVATVKSVTAYGTGNPDRKEVYVGVSLETLQFDDRTYYDGGQIREGSTLPISTEEYTFSGTIHQTDSLEQRGTPTTKTVTLRQTDVHAQIAETLEPGMTEQSGETNIARITAVDVEPSTILIQGQDGDLGVYDHPTNRNVMITAELTVRETVSGVQFKGDTIQQGSTVTIDLGTQTIRATVMSIK